MPILQHTHVYNVSFILCLSFVLATNGCCFYAPAAGAEIFHPEFLQLIKMAFGCRNSLRQATNHSALSSDEMKTDEMRWDEMRSVRWTLLNFSHSLTHYSHLSLLAFTWRLSVCIGYIGTSTTYLRRTLVHDDQHDVDLSTTSARSDTDNVLWFQHPVSWRFFLVLLCSCLYCLIASNKLIDWLIDWLIICLIP